MDSTKVTQNLIYFNTYTEIWLLACKLLELYANIA